MTKRQKLILTDRILFAATVLILASGIQLEATGSSGINTVVMHIAAGLVFIGLCALHIQLHFGFSGWFKKFSRLKSQPTRVLWWTSLVLTASAVIATVRWIFVNAHGPAGAVHGKIGFLMILLCIVHIAKRFRAML